MLRITLISALLLGTLLALPATAADLTLATTEKSPPEGVAGEISAVLEATAIQLKNGEEPEIEIWLRKETPLKDTPEEPRTAMKAIAQGTLLGVMAVHKDRRDYRDDDIAEGVYTMRFALQPQNGDHLGTSVYPYYALLIPVAHDTSLDGIEGYDAVTEASSEDTATEHPVIVSLRPADADDASEPKLTEPADDHKAVQVSLPATLPEGEKTSLSIEVVYKGLGQL